MSETPLVGPPADAGDSDAPGEDGLPLSSLRGAGPQNAVAPGADPADPPGGDPTQSAPGGDPGGSASDLGSETDPGSLDDSGSATTTSSDPLPDPSGS